MFTKRQMNRSGNLVKRPVSVNQTSQAGTCNDRLVSYDEMSPDAAINSLVNAFDDVSLVALGERHWSSEDASFRLSLIRHPTFAQKVSDIVVEFANPRHQPILDSFLSGAEVPSVELERVWQDTTQPGT